MPSQRCYQIGTDLKGSCGVTYSPDRSPDEAIGFWEGFGQGLTGGSCSFVRALKARHNFECCHAEWFLPLLERLARSEAVSLEEIQNACHTATGHEMPLLDAWSKPILTPGAAP